MSAKKSLLFVFVAAALFSIGGLCVKVIPWNPLSINGFRSLVSACLLLLFAKATGQKWRVTPGIFAGACAICATNCLYTMANKLTTAANTILIQFSAPVFVILFLWAVFHERPKRRDVVACVIVFGGIGCFFLDGLGNGNLLGDALALLSGATYAWVFLLGKIPNGDPLFSTILGQLMGGLVGLPFLVGETSFAPVTLTAALALGVFQLGVAYMFFTMAIRYAPPVSACLVTGIEPILNPVLVALFVGEMISPLSLVGGVIVFATIMVYQVQSSREEKNVHCAAGETMV